ncbi:D-glycero-beta-D-manno-heptose 1-phosphate adenylyltransferase [Nocardia rosealba]|uniref:D-glycero-beta-D-manno-heptose 1-phosphate adenylyltransferase n=1 Tax=Nocardia rosealba TaxID=2878563 RepID=UPI001CDA43E8|nr:D-glycero-beta-D-manno-heptose 1-phosphate adenylyltransferase [Nocardia rosealba]MCA2207487.1 D-glycero-beta-D-manno-heptose 1-phosphate adenylyltransferase [Nocardia rosealba]
MPFDRTDLGFRGPGPESVDHVAARRPRVVVLGDAVLDVWKWGRCHRLCREGPVPVVDVADTAKVPGAAANTAANLAALGAQVQMVATVGDDDAGHDLRDSLRRAGVGTDTVVADPTRNTEVKVRVMADEQILLRYDEDCAPVHTDTTALLAALDTALADADALLICDYGVTLDDTIRDALCARRDSLPLLVLDAHEPARWQALRPDLVTPNAEEAAALLDTTAHTDHAQLFIDRRDELMTRTGAAAVVVTLDKDGTVLLVDGKPAHRTWAVAVPENRSAGAGDTFVAALTAAVLDAMPLTGAVEFAQAAADVVLRSPGTSVCRCPDLRARLGGEGSGVLSRDRFIATVRRERAEGARVVFTNGCFDVLHAGHIACLNEAKSLGDILVVAVNSDSSVRRLKGPERPVNTAGDRCAVLAALSCVDHVTVFDEDTPAELLRATEPQLYVKGGDYRPDMLPETAVVTEYGGQVRVLNYLADHSTTTMIDRIRGRVGDR